jgi:hypothetical protein
VPPRTIGLTPASSTSNPRLKPPGANEDRALLTRARIPLASDRRCYAAIRRGAMAVTIQPSRSPKSDSPAQSRRRTVLPAAHIEGPSSSQMSSLDTAQPRVHTHVSGLLVSPTVSPQTWRLRLAMRRSGRRSTEGLPVNLLAYPPDSSRPPQDAPEQFQVGRSAVIHPGFGRKQSSSGLTATLTATQAGTSGTAWTISRTLTPRPDVSGCPGTICADLRIRRLGVRIPPGAPVFSLVMAHFFDWRPSPKRHKRPVDSNAVQFGWTKTRSMASAASRSAVGMTWE